MPEATSQAYKHFATEYGPVTEIVRKEDPLLMRAAGGTDAVLRYAWKLQSKFKKKRWADSARTVSKKTFHASFCQGKKSDRNVLLAGGWVGIAAAGDA